VPNFREPLAQDSCTEQL